MMILIPTWVVRWRDAPLSTLQEMRVADTNLEAFLSTLRMNSVAWLECEREQPAP